MLKSIVCFCTALAFSLSASAEGYVHASGKKVLDINGQELILRGHAPGGWMIQEPYMMEIEANSQHEIRARIQDLLGEKNTEAFYRKWLENGFRKEDVRLLAEMGFNSIRLPMHYNLFTLPIEEEPERGANTWLETGFQLVDNVLAWCKEYGIYLILDMHGAPGGQGKDTNISDYDPSKLSLWESADNQDKLVALWVKLADRYANEPYIAAYDLVNEPNWAFDGDNANGCDECQNAQIWDLYKRLIRAIREVDKNHMIILEGNCWCNNYNGLPTIRLWDSNLCLQFHKYWSDNTKGSIQGMLDLRDSKNVPLWCGESGENSTHWYADAVRLLEENGIGWSWWTWKKIGSVNGMTTVKAPAGYETLKNYWKNGGTKPSQAYATQVMNDLADAYLLENCTVNKGVADALLRQPHTSELKPFAENKVPGYIYASNYDMGQNGVAYLDLDGVEDTRPGGVFKAWNQGWCYRADGVDIEACKDVNTNGYSVGWTAAGEWMKYTIDVAETAAYTLIVRYASTNAKTVLRLEVDGAAIVPDMELKSSGGWATWRSAMASNLVLPQGKHVLRVLTVSGGANLNYFSFLSPKPVSSADFKALSAITSEDGKCIFLSVNRELKDAAMAADGFQVESNSIPVSVEHVGRSSFSNWCVELQLGSKLYLDNKVTLSYNGASVTDAEDNPLPAFSGMAVTNVAEERAVIPGTIHVEDYTAQSGLSFETCSDTGGGATNFGYTDPGDYIDFNVYITQGGTYTLDYRIAALYGNGRFEIQLFDEAGNKTVVGSYAVGATGGWQTWKTQRATAKLPQGSYLLRIYIAQKEFNMNWFRLSNPTAVVEMLTPVLNVYPNPCHETLYVDTRGLQGTGILSLYSLSGTEVLSQRHEMGRIIALGVSSLPSELYVLSLKAAGASLTQKIVLD